MKKLLILVLLIALATTVYAKKDKKEEPKPDVYQFTMIKQLPTTPVKDQYKSGTCWSFSGVSFIETELLRLGKPEMDLSEMFIVRTNYAEKAKKYVRYHGKTNFGGGGNFHDNLNTMRNYGLIPNEAYQGLDYGEKKHTHGELDNVLESYLNAILRNANGKLSTKWLDGYNGILDAYLGPIPQKFDYKGKSYTPRSFADELGINPDEYVEITSFTHHPMYKPFVLELPDNWTFEISYNVPLDDMIRVIDNAIDNGYSVAWGGDVSSKGFSHKKQGLAVILQEEYEDMKGSEISKWDEIPERERQDSLYNFTEIRPEKNITSEYRQLSFDNWDVTDDHGMHIVGVAQDQKGNRYYYTKNSWNDDSNKFKGYLYMSVPFVKWATTSIMVHKNAIPADIKAKLGL
jgi:bleomycin hydrolase